MVADNWRIHNFASIQDWQNDIEYLNKGFQVNLKQYWLDSRKLSFSKSVNDRAYPSDGLLIKFNDVFIDYDNYNLYLSMQFIDLATNEILLKVEKEKYYGNRWGFTGYLSYSLDLISQKITWLILQKDKGLLLE